MTRLHPLAAAAGLALLAGCGHSDPTPPSPLSVVSTTPADGERDVDTAVTLEVVFSVAVAPSTVEKTHEIVLQDESFHVIPATVRVDTADPTRVTVDPTKALADDTTFGLAIRAGVATPKGERIAAPVGIRFSTGATLAPMPGWPPFSDPATAPPAPGSFVRAQNEMSVGRQGAAGVVLSDGRAFVHGGRDTAGAALGTADMYRPTTDDFALGGTGGAPVGRWGHTATLLGDGRVLLTGGDSGSAVLADTPIYDPATDTYPAGTTSLATARVHHTAVRLGSGKVLAVGGWSGAAALAGCELYDPTTGTWAATGSLATARAWHTTTTLPDGRVLAAGGGDGTNALASAEIYDPNTATWTATGNLNTARQRHAATLMPTGSGAGFCLVTGGEQPGAATPVLNGCELFDPNGNGGVGIFAPTGAGMGTARTGHTATFLTASGHVLVVGGASTVLPPVAGAFTPLAGAERFDALGGGTTLGTGFTGILAQGTWTGTTDGSGNPTQQVAVAVGRAGHLALPLGSGAVLLVGGTDRTGTAPYALPTGERYTP